MSLKDLQAHSIGRRHRLALGKVNADPKPLPSSSRTAPAGARGKDIQKRGPVGSDRAAPTPMHSAVHDVHTSVTPLVGSHASEPVRKSTAPVETVKQVTNKAKTPKKAKRPKDKVKSIATPPASAGIRILGLSDNFIGNRQPNGNPNHSMCGQGCGWCGQYMNHLTDAYVVLTYRYTCPITLCRSI